MWPQVFYSGFWLYFQFGRWNESLFVSSWVPFIVLPEHIWVPVGICPDPDFTCEWVIFQVLFKLSRQSERIYANFWLFLAIFRYFSYIVQLLYHFSQFATQFRHTFTTFLIVYKQFFCHFQCQISWTRFVIARWTEICRIFGSKSAYRWVQQMYCAYKEFVKNINRIFSFSHLATLIPHQR